MFLAQTQCCAIREINGLSRHPTPAAAMMEFCRQATAYNSTLPGLITFTGVVACRCRKSRLVPPPPPLHKIGYGEAFAAFIREHGLGDVREGPIQINRQNHPTHKVRLWSWAPAPRKLATWYKKERGA